MGTGNPKMGTKFTNEKKGRELLHQIIMWKWKYLTKDDGLGWFPIMIKKVYVLFITIDGSCRSMRYKTIYQRTDPHFIGLACLILSEVYYFEWVNTENNKKSING